MWMHNSVCIQRNARRPTSSCLPKASLCFYLFYITGSSRPLRFTDRPKKVICVQTQTCTIVTFGPTLDKHVRPADHVLALSDPVRANERGTEQSQIERDGSLSSHTYRGVRLWNRSTMIEIGLVTLFSRFLSRKQGHEVHRDAEH